MNKLDMAHDYMVAWMQSGNSEIVDANELAGFFFSVADAMQAEADKREPKGFPDVLQEEKCLHHHYSMIANKCLDCGEVLKMADSPQLDCQPDWSVEKKADAWRMYGDGNCAWLIDVGDNEFKWYQPAPSFDYQGDWKQSLRKRPHEA